MYNTTLDSSKAKYCLIKQISYGDYVTQYNVSGIVTGWNIYVCSFQDACAYVTQNLLHFYSTHYKYITTKQELYERLLENAKYMLLSGSFDKPRNLKTYTAIYVWEYDFHVSVNETIGNIDFLPEENVLLKNFIHKTIEKIVNGIKVEYFYSFPIYKSKIKVNELSVRDTKTRKHAKSYHDVHLHKRDLVLSQDIEYRQYLDARDRFTGKNLVTCQYGNKKNIPSGWKYLHKCNKQWAKHISNPSYEKLSKAVWRYAI